MARIEEKVVRAGARRPLVSLTTFVSQVMVHIQTYIIAHSTVHTYDYVIRSVLFSDRHESICVFLVSMMDVVSCLEDAEVADGDHVLQLLPPSWTIILFCD